MLRYFKLSEFDQPGAVGSGEKMNPLFLQKMDQLRHVCGFPFIIPSGFRYPEYNIKVSSTGENGPHTTGRACDVAVSGEQAYIVLRVAMELGFTGIGIKQKGEGRFIHLDDLTEADGYPRPRIWSY